MAEPESNSRSLTQNKPEYCGQYATRRQRKPTIEAGQVLRSNSLLSCLIQARL